MDFNMALSPNSKSKELPKIILKFKRNHLHSYVYLVFFQSQKALKVVKKKKIFSSFFINELLIQTKLQGLDIERIFNQNVTSEEYNLTLAEPLGPSLKQLFQLCEFNFSVSTICHVGIRLLKLIQQIHARKVVHCNLNPSKVLINLENPAKLFICDFGRSVCFDCEIRRPMKAGQAISKNRKGLEKIGVFSGRNILNGAAPSFLDDLDSILSILLYLFNGPDWIKGEVNNYDTLPYEGRNKAIETYKLITSNEALCNKAPKLFLEFCKYVRELREGEYIDYVGMIASLKLVASNLENSQNQADLKGKFSWLNHEKFEDLIKSYQISSLKNSPSSSPTNKSPNNKSPNSKGLSNFSKATASLNTNGMGQGGLSPTNKPPSNGGGMEKYNNQLKLEKIQEECVSEKKASVLEKINLFNKNSEFVFKNSFNPNSSSQNSSRKKEELEFEEGGSPNKSDYAMFQVKKDELCFSALMKEL